MEDHFTFDVDADQLFSATQRIVRNTRDMRIDHSDALTRRLSVSVSMGWTTWGETMTISVSPIDKNQSLLTVTSRQRIYSATGKKKQMIRISELFSAVARELQASN
ncbi:MAG: hypothetical protein ACYCYO_08290 [Bacilli bacterium]